MDISTVDETTTISRNVTHQPSSNVVSRLKRTERSSFISGNYRKGEECTGCWWGNPRGRDRWGDQGVDGRIILGWIFRWWD